MSLSHLKFLLILCPKIVCYKASLASSKSPVDTTFLSQSYIVQLFAAHATIHRRAKTTESKFPNGHIFYLYPPFRLTGVIFSGKQSVLTEKCLGRRHKKVNRVRIGNNFAFSRSFGFRTHKYRLWLARQAREVGTYSVSEIWPIFIRIVFGQGGCFFFLWRVTTMFLQTAWFEALFATDLFGKLEV